MACAVGPTCAHDARAATIGRPSVPGSLAPCCKKQNAVLPALPPPLPRAFARMISSCSSRTFSMDQSGEIPAMVVRKCFKVCIPRSECVT